MVLWRGRLAFDRRGMGKGEARRTGSILHAARTVASSCSFRSDRAGTRKSWPPHFTKERRHGHPRIFPSTLNMADDRLTRAPIPFGLMVLGGSSTILHGGLKETNTTLVGSMHTTALMTKRPQATLLFAPPFLTPFSYPDYRGLSQRPLNFPFILVDTPALHANLLFSFFYISLTPHQTRRRVRWLRPPRLRPSLFRPYLRKHLDSYLRYRRRTRRFRLSRGLYLCYLLRSYPILQTRGTDSLLVCLPHSRLVRV